MEETEGEQILEEEEDLSTVSLSSDPRWEWMGRCSDFWNSIKRPGRRLLEYSKLDLNEEEINGILTDRIIATGHSCLGRCPQLLGYVYTKLELKKKASIQIYVYGIIA